MSKNEKQPDSMNEDSGGFSFEPLPAGEESDRSEAFAQEEQLRESLSASGGSPKGKSSMVRLLLLVLLIVVLGGAGVYFYFGMEEPPPPVPVAVKKKPVAVPPKPEPVKEIAKEASPEVPKEVVKETVTSVEKTPPAPVQEPISTVVSEKPPLSQPLEAPLATVAAAKKYTVQAGAFLLESNLSRSQKKIRELGYEPVVKIRQKDVQMTRLRVGTYPMREAKDKLADVKQYAPDASMSKEGTLYAVYAGTYYDLDKARSFADRLYEKGVIIEEESVMLPQPLHVLSFGEFSDLSSAREAANRAKGIGMDVFVSKIR